jgi:hypothetical protein
MNTQVSQNARERRRYHRYDASNISISLKSTEDLKANESLSIIDFNRFGLALFSNQSFKIGDTLNLVLSDSSGDKVEITAFVCNRAPTEDGFRCGLCFIETNISSENQTTKLFEMEQALESIAS